MPPVLDPPSRIDEQISVEDAGPTHWDLVPNCLIGRELGAEWELPHHARPAIVRRLDPADPQVAGAEAVPRTEAVDRGRFEQLADEWEDATWAHSFVERKILDRAYQRIMGMGPDVVPLILERLRDRGPDHWFWALEIITGENPASDAASMQEATDAWLAWGRRNGFV